MRTLDDLQNGYQIFQEQEGFRFGIDAVLLAHFPALAPGMRVLDLGCGSGVIPHILAARARDQKIQIAIDGLELDERACACAQDSVEHNRLSGLIRITRGDVREAAAIYGEASFLLVTANPPYQKAGSGRLSAHPSRAMARAEVEGSLQDWLDAARSVLLPGGHFVMVHKSARLLEIEERLHALGFTVLRKRLVHPFASKEANLVLLDAVKGALSAEAAAARGQSKEDDCREEPPLIIYREDGSYTEELLSIYGGK